MIQHFATPSLSKFQRLLVVIKQTAYEEYSQLKLRGQAPKALRWKRLESRYRSHKQCVNDLLSVLGKHKVNFSCVNRVELDRQHLADVDLVIAVGGDGTVLSACHFLDHGTIPLLGVNSDPISLEDTMSNSIKKKSDERRSHGALCMATSHNMHDVIPEVLYGGAKVSSRTRIQCIVKSTFSETKLVPALNDILICNPSPAAVSRFRMGWLKPVDDPQNRVQDSFSERDYNYFQSSFNENSLSPQKHTTNEHYGTVTRFGGLPFDIARSLNVWSSGLWVSTSTGSSAAMHAAGGMDMDGDTSDLQYLIREHMIEARAGKEVSDMNNKLIHEGEQVHIRWNSQKGRIFIDGSHLVHNLDLGDEILINNKAPPIQIFTKAD